jgi:2-polyprenyl-3-methyl-5-hydroxy-6-metoxy-1,4-benzoquinol methylase
MTELDHAALFEEIQNHYKVGPGYAQLYLKAWLEDPARSYNRLEDFLNAPSPWPMWFDYAMSTNQRGQDAVQLLRPYLPAGARRALDVGCGFGGFVVAFSQNGLESIGIELDPERVELSRANCLDHGLKDGIFQVSILEPGLKERLGTFDVITCNDVIEHVLDVPLALQNIVSLLNPGGILLMEIPNKDSLAFVGRDGHFELFGITQLERPEAVTYFHSFFQNEYDVGYYYELKDYQRFLHRLGCTDRLLNPPGSIKMQAPPAAKKFWQGYQRYRQEQLAKISAHTSQQINVSVRKYLFSLALRGLVGIFTPQGRQDLRRRYLMDFWTIMAVKEPAP